MRTINKRRLAEAKFQASLHNMKIPDHTGAKQEPLKLTDKQKEAADKALEEAQKRVKERHKHGRKR